MRASYTMTHATELEPNPLPLPRKVFFIMTRSPMLRSSRLAAIVLSGALMFGATAPIVAQDGTTPAADSELSSETATQLPPADLPTMSQQGFVFELTSTFDGNFNEVVDEAPVYEMQFPTFDAESAASSAEQFDVEGEIEEQGESTFTITGENGSIYITPGLIQFISSEPVPEGELPTDEEAIAFAREWLRQVGMLPANVGEGSIQTRVENPGRIIVTFQPIEPAPLLSASPNILVILGPQGSILESSIRWAEISQADMYQLRGAESAWSEVESMRSYVDTTLPADTFESGATITGTATYTSVSLAYTSSGIPGEQQFLQPVYAFEGTLTPDGSEESYPITSYVPALINSQQPVG